MVLESEFVIESVISNWGVCDSIVMYLSDMLTFQVRPVWYVYWAYGGVQMVKVNNGMVWM